MLYMNKYKFDEFFVEITKRCNLKCLHCMNGEAQDATITYEIIDKIFENAADCKNIVFGGGETLLKIEMIEYFMAKLLQSNWTTETVQLTTNGSIMDSKIIDMLNAFCAKDSNRIALLRISADQFHDANISKKAYNYYCGLPKNERVRVELKTTLNSIKYTGRAVNYITNNPTTKIDDVIGVYMPHIEKHRIRVDDNTVACSLHITSNGDVSFSEEIAYEDIDRLAIGNILTEAIEKMIERNNNECLLSCCDLKNMQTIKQYISNINDLYIDAFVGSSRIEYRIGNYIYDSIYKLRKEAHKLFPYVPTQDIITTLPMPKDYMFDVKKEIDDVYACLPLSFRMMDERSRVRWLAKTDFNLYSIFLNTKNSDDGVVKNLIVFALYQHPILLFLPFGGFNLNTQIGNVLKKINSLTRFYRLVTSNFADLPEHQTLSELNEKYKSGELTYSNDKVLPCEIGESFDSNEFNLYQAVQDYLLEQNKQISV